MSLRPRMDVRFREVSTYACGKASRVGLRCFRLAPTGTLFRASRRLESHSLPPIISYISMADKPGAQQPQIVEVHCPKISFSDIRGCFPPDWPTFVRRCKETCISFLPHGLTQCKLSVRLIPLSLAVLVFCQIALAGMKVYSQMTLSELKDGFVFSAMWGLRRVVPVGLMPITPPSHRGRAVPVHGGIHPRR